MRNRLARLEARRIDPMLKEAKLLNEVYRGIQQSESVRYAIGAMQPIDPEYTRNTFAQGDRVRDQLARRLTQSCDYRYQGSTTNDTHIRARSDVDLLVILTAWYWLQPPQVPANPYRGDEKQDMRALRSESEESLQDAFPAADVDGDGSKAICIDGGSLTRRIDVVPATWYNSNHFAQTGDETVRGVRVFDIETGAFITNYPFLHNACIDVKDARTLGGLRKAARLMKSLKYDSDTVTLSSYDIVSIAYNIPDNQLAFAPPFELRIVDSSHDYCVQLSRDASLRSTIHVPNGTRPVFGGRDGATEKQLDELVAELRQLRQDILSENARSFVKLAEARVEHGLRPQPVFVP